MVADTEDDDIPLVSLDTLDVLHEEALFIRLREELVEGRVVQLPETTHQRVLDVGGVVLAESDDAQGFRWRLAGMVEDEVHDHLNLVRVGARAGYPGDRPEGNEAVGDGAIDDRSREGGQGSAVDVAVGESDEAIVPAPVVPLQHLVAQEHTSRIEQ